MLHRSLLYTQGKKTRHEASRIHMTTSRAFGNSEERPRHDGKSNFVIVWHDRLNQELLHPASSGTFAAPRSKTLLSKYSFIPSANLEDTKDTTTQNYSNMIYATVNT